jgi:hypothetical protein
MLRARSLGFRPVLCDAIGIHVRPKKIPGKSTGSPAGFQMLRPCLQGWPIDLPFGALFLRNHDRAI